MNNIKTMLTIFFVAGLAACGGPDVDLDGEYAEEKMQTYEDELAETETNLIRSPGGITPCSTRSGNDRCKCLCETAYVRCVLSPNASCTSTRTTCLSSCSSGKAIGGGSNSLGW